MKPAKNRTIMHGDLDSFYASVEQRDNPRLRGRPVLVGAGQAIAATLQRRVRDEVGLALSIGVATTKFLAKAASAVSKPNGLLVIEPGKELEFLHPLPVRRLWGVGPVTAAKLNGRGLDTVADVAALDQEELVSILGPGWGRHLHALAHNHDARSVDTARPRRSIGAQRAFPRCSPGRDEAEVILLEVIERVIPPVRRQGPTPPRCCPRRDSRPFRSSCRHPHQPARPFVPRDAPSARFLACSAECGVTPLAQRKILDPHPLASTARTEPVDRRPTWRLG